MHPLHICLGFSKKRWQFVFEDEQYDKNRDSNYQNISFLLGIPESPKLWQGGKISGIENFDTQKYAQWIIEVPTIIEKRIKEKSAQIP
jgi:hypothetical protein